MGVTKDRGNNDETAPKSAAGARRNLTMPGLSATVGEEIAALKRVAGDKVAARIKRDLHDALALGPDIRLCAVGTLERPQGKAVRVVDRRPR